MLALLRTKLEILRHLNVRDDSEQWETKLTFYPYALSQINLFLLRLPLCPRAHVRRDADSH